MFCVVFGFCGAFFSFAVIMCSEPEIKAGTELNCDKAEIIEMA